MDVTQKQQSISWREIGKDLPVDQQIQERRKVLNELVSVQFDGWDADSMTVMGQAAGRNCEQIVGVTSVPTGIVGPLRIDGKDIHIPLATTEGALVASVQRGSKATLDGITTQVDRVGTTRSLVFSVEGIEKGQVLVGWVNQHQTDLKKVAEASSTHLRLLKIESQWLGKQVYIKFWFDTGEAMGMNMVTIACQKIADLIGQETGAKTVSLSSNGCVDKKPAFENFRGRGHIVRAEAVIRNQVCEEVLHVSPRDICEVVEHKQWLGSMLSGSMGFNAHYANMVAALYLATGQDMAHVVEGSLGITTAHEENNDLYFSVYLPAVMVGSVGGGTHLPSQQTTLSVMGLGTGQPGERDRLAAFVGATVLCGELSLTAALASGSLADAHRRLGRKQQ